jgi:hypothetical protein
MAYKSFKSVVLAMVIAASCNTAHSITTDSVYKNAEEGQYIFLERMFEVEPILPFGKTTRDITTAGIIASGLFLATREGFTIREFPRNVKSADLAKIALVLSGVWYVYSNYYVDTKKEAVYADLLVKFVKNWDKYRELTPTEFHELFDSLAELLTQQGEQIIRDRSLEVTKTVQHVLAHHFDKHHYYASHRKGSSQSASALLAEITNTVKTLVAFK